MQGLLYTLPLGFFLGVGTAGAQSAADTEAGQRGPAEIVPAETPFTHAPQDPGWQDRAARNSATITSAQNVASAQEDQRVKLRGRIVSQQSHNQYVLSDGSGSVVIEINNRLLNGKQLAAGAEVEIRGAVDKRKSPKVDAQSVRVLAAADGMRELPPAGAQPDERG
jgi:uncharacterized protein (TIGR00156 family)